MKITFLGVIQQFIILGGITMWVLTVFDGETFRIFEFETKEEAMKALEKIQLPAILSYTNLTLVA